YFLAVRLRIRARTFCQSYPGRKIRRSQPTAEERRGQWRLERIDYDCKRSHSQRPGRNESASSKCLHRWTSRIGRRAARDARAVARVMWEGPLCRDEDVDDGQKS